MRRFLPYLHPHPHRVGYIGWTGHENLGDEALADAVEMLLGDLRITEMRLSGKTRSLERLRLGRGLFKGVILGGGTLINAQATYETFVESLERYPLGVVFGTGVLDPEFWDGVPGFVDDRERWAELLSRLPLVGVRGPDSRRLLMEAGLDDVAVIGDPALALGDAVVAPKEGRRRLGFNVGTSLGRVWGSEAAIADWAVDCVDALTGAGWEVVLLPVWTADLPFMEAVAARLRRPVSMHRPFLDLDATLDFLRSCDVFVGQKLHSVVLAHCVHTPALALEYRPKCGDYMRSVGQEEWRMRTDRLDVDRLLADVGRLHDEAPAHQASIHDAISRHRRSLVAFGDQVQRLFRSAAYPRVA